MEKIAHYINRIIIYPFRDKFVTNICKFDTIGSSKKIYFFVYYFIGRRWQYGSWPVYICADDVQYNIWKEENFCATNIPGGGICSILFSINIRNHYYKYKKRYSYYSMLPVLYSLLLSLGNLTCRSGTREISSWNKNS